MSVSYDDLAVCRNHRLGSEILDAIGKQIKEYSEKGEYSDNVPIVYHGYMLEATEKIAETSRHIITSSSNYIPIYYKCEIETIRKSLCQLLQSTDNILHSSEYTKDLRDAISKEQDFIRHTIAVHSQRMSHEEFDEGAPAYSYLMLLYYLHSFMSTFSRIVNNIELIDKEFMTS